MTLEGSINEKREKEAKLLAFLTTGKRTGLEIVLCILSGWAFSSIFEVLSWHIFAYVGIVPLFLLIYARSMKRAFLYGFIWGYFWHLGAFFWLREIFCLIPFVMAAVLGVFNAFFAMMIPFLFKYLFFKPSSLSLEADKRCVLEKFSFVSELFFALAAAALWTVLEYIRSHIFTGLPWNLLGASQWNVPTIIQIADITGIYGITFLIVLINAALFTLLLSYTGIFVSLSSPWRKCFPMPGTAAEERRRAKRRVLPRPLVLMFSLALAAMASSYSFVKLRQYGSMEGEGQLFLAGVVQPDLSQRRHGGQEATKEALAVCVALSEALFQDGKVRPHTVIWPETAVPCPFNASLETSDLLRRELYRMIQSYNTPFLFGATRLDKTAQGDKLLIYNSALLWKKGNILTHFDKIHIVPFGEFVPYGDRFPVLNRIVGMGRNLDRGKKFNFLELQKGVRAGISICYEDVFPYVSRNHVLNGANLLLTITNDAWYPTSNEPAQHFANSLFRAIECRLPFLRVGNMDYSCVISPSGIVKEAFGRKKNGKADPSYRGRTSGVFSFYVPQKYTPTFYVKYGDLFTGICLLLFLFIFAVALLNLKNWKQYLLESLQEEKGEEK